jgi:peptide deformylase
VSKYNLKLIVDPTDKRLYEKAKRVKEPHSAQTFGIVQEMKAMAREYDALGLAANQLGVNRRIIVAYHEGLHEFLEFINPRIVQSSLDPGDMYYDIEGCYSHPGITAEVKRYRNIQLICYQLSHPSEIRCQLSGMLARIVQHEIDHLDGKLMSDLGPFILKNVFLDAQGQDRLFKINARRQAQADFVVD